ncbi:hypothetical protein B0H14DRAFT_3127323 [Mycena olivaceomarginata]|nr:hypothetical protein B0H14DRAFT_3127323 [Mycena olivaceomarginata]
MSHILRSGRKQNIRSTRKKITTSPRCRKEIATTPRCHLSVDDENKLQRGRSWLHGGNGRPLTLLRLVRRSASQKARRDGDL